MPTTLPISETAAAAIADGNVPLALMTPVPPAPKHGLRVSAPVSPFSDNRHTSVLSFHVVIKLKRVARMGVQQMMVCQRPNRDGKPDAGGKDRGC